MPDAHDQIFETTMRNYFLDTTALIRLVCDEPGSRTVRALLNDPGSSLLTSWVLLAEALGVLKRKRLDGELTDTDYERMIQELFLRVQIGSIRPVDVAVLDGEARLITYGFELARVRRRHPCLDAADALQLRAIEEGILKLYAGESKPRLVSADKNLLAAAREEGIDTISVCKDLPNV